MHRDARAVQGFFNDLRVASGQQRWSPVNVPLLWGAASVEETVRVLDWLVPGVPFWFKFIQVLPRCAEMSRGRWVFDEELSRAMWQEVLWSSVQWPQRRNQSAAAQPLQPPQNAQRPWSSLAGPRRPKSPSHRTTMPPFSNHGSGPGLASRPNPHQGGQNPSVEFGRHPPRFLRCFGEVGTTSGPRCQGLAGIRFASSASKASPCAGHDTLLRSLFTHS